MTRSRFVLPAGIVVALAAALSLVLLLNVTPGVDDDHVPVEGRERNSQSTVGEIPAATDQTQAKQVDPAPTPTIPEPRTEPAATEPSADQDEAKKSARKRVCGWVVSSSTKGPIAGATVTLDPMRKSPLTTKSDAMGRFEFSMGSGPEVVAVTAVAPGFASTRMENLLVSDSRAERIPIVLRPAAILVGKVFDDRGNPRDDTIVWVTAKGFEDRLPGMPTPFHHTVVRGGNFRIEGLAEGATYDVAVFPRKGRETLEATCMTLLGGRASPIPLAKSTVTLRAGEVRSLIFRLGRSKTIVGTVHDQDGVAPGESVILTAAPRLSDFAPNVGQQFADDQGRFRFKDIQPGTYYLVVVNASAPPERRIAREFTQVVVGDSDTEVRQDIRVFRGLYIEGRVLDPDSRPVHGASVGATAMKGDLDVDATSGPDGQFRLGPLTPAEFRITASSDAWVRAMPVRAIAGTKGLVVSLGRGGEVHGLVFSSAEPGHVTIDARHQTGLHWRRVVGVPVTQPNGKKALRFELRGLAPGSYDLLAVGQHGAVVGYVGSVQVAAGETTRGVKIELAPGGTLLVDTGRDDPCDVSLFTENGVRLPCWCGGRRTMAKAPAGAVRVVVERKGHPRLEKTVRVEVGKSVTVRFD